MRTAQQNGHTNYTAGIFPRRSPDHPVFLPRPSTRLRLRPGMALLYMALVALTVLLIAGWALAAFLLPFNVLAIVVHRKPFDPMSAIGPRGVVSKP